MSSTPSSTTYTSHVRGLPEPPLWLRTIVPAVVYPVLLVSAFAYRPFYDFMQDKEGGIEWLAVLVLFVGVAYGVRMLVRYRHRLPARWLVWWFAISTFGMFVLAGEEMSWGQHLKLWSRADLPQWLRAINDQDETNFHNITNALDQGPTNVVVGGTFVAFVLLPIYQRFKRKTMPLDDPGYWFWPTPACLPAAIGVLVIPFPGRIYEWTTGIEKPQTLRHSEFHEFYIALLMTTYVVSAFYRLRAIPDAAGDRSEARTAGSAPPCSSASHPS